MMAHPSAKNYPNGLIKVAVTVFLLSLLTLVLPSKSAGLVLGSRPPGCVNKCMSCRPCLATLVIPPPHDDTTSSKGFFKESSISSFHGGKDQENGYYLLSWKCTCGNRLYHP